MAPSVAETAPRQRARLAVAELARQALRGAPAPDLLESFATALPGCSIGPLRVSALLKQAEQVREQLERGAPVATLVSTLEAAYHAAVRAADGGRR